MPVYIARRGITGNVKIGFAIDVGKRMKQLQTGQSDQLRVMRLLAGELADEKALHGRFAAFALTGEWFRFHRDMMGDVGLPDLPIPRLGKCGKFNWPSEPRHYEHALHHEILQIIGGEEALARRVGVRPWAIIHNWGRIHSEWWAAVIIALRERGRGDITYHHLHETRDAVSAADKTAADNKWLSEKLKNEAEWIKKHPGVMPWWEVYEPNRQLLEQSLASAAPATSKQQTAA